MFRWISLTIALTTFFWSWWVTIGGLLVVALILFVVSKKNYGKLGWYVAGILLAVLALRRMYISVAALQTIPVPAELTWLVIDQRSADTRVVAWESYEFLLRSNREVRVGDQITVVPFFTRATIPVLSWKQITMPWFLRGEIDFDRWLAMKRYLGWWYVSWNQLMVVSTQKTSLSWIQKIRHIYKEYVVRVFGSSQTAALVLWLTTGDRSWFSREQYTMFVDTGLVHLLAVSGSNVVYVSLLLSLLFFWLPFYIRLCVVSVILVIYGLICGTDSSVIRAISMGIVWLMATWKWRWVAIDRVLILVAGVMLLWNPLVLWYDLWFLLSFGAVCWIIVTQRLVSRYVPISAYGILLLSYMLPCLWATLGVFPILILWTGKISVSSVWINMLVWPLVPVFLVLSGGVLFLPDWWFGMRILELLTNKLLDFTMYAHGAWAFLVVDEMLFRVFFLVIYGLCGWWAYELLRPDDTTWQDCSGCNLPIDQYLVWHKRA